MRVVSVNVSAGRVVQWRGQPVHTGIFKEPVDGRVMIRTMHVEGDRQADRSVHGGALKAVYAYALEDYAWWGQALQRELPFGMFGENLTIDGLDPSVAIGDVFAVGNARLQAVQPRLPCFKLGLRFEDPQMVARFMRSGRLGIYFRVLAQGDVGAGDEMTCVQPATDRVPVLALAAMLDPRVRDPELARRALRLEALAPQWVDVLERHIDEDDA